MQFGYPGLQGQELVLHRQRRDPVLDGLDEFPDLALDCRELLGDGATDWRGALRATSWKLGPRGPEAVVGCGDQSPREMKSTYALVESRVKGRSRTLRFALALLAPKHCHGVNTRRPSNGYIGRERRGSNEQQRRTDHAWQIERIDTEQHAANERTGGCCSN